MISTGYMLENSPGPNRDAKTALRDAIQAKLKTSKYDDEKSVDHMNSFFPSAFDDGILQNDDSDSNEELEGKLDDKDCASSGVPVEERRLRNRLAARKCREKRKQRIIDLEKICSNLEGRISSLQNEIEGLDVQKQNLSRALENHLCVKLSPKPIAVITNSARK